MEKSVISKTNTKTGEYYSPGDEEESSWTFYFEDFLNDNDYTYDQETNNRQNDEINDDNTTNNHLVSDTGSKKLQGDDGLSWDKTYKKLSFKKRKKGAVVVDDSLEDTASSPVNSPKVGFFSDHSDMNRKEKEIMAISEEKLGFGIGGDYTELKKRGLCLVPVSSLANYFP